MNLFVVIPAYNATDTLPSLLERTIRFVPPENIVVVNDGSRDTTETVARTFGVRIISHGTNKGKGAALQSGFDAAVHNGCDAVITMDADLQHQPEDIPRFVTLYELRKHDVIIGSRLHNKKGMPFHRILSNTITTFLVSLRTGATVSDSQSGFRFITRRVLEQVKLQTTGFEAETEFILRAAKQKFSFGSMPIETVYAGEKSHMTHMRTTINFVKVLFKEY
ncbi:MAG: glycosyltransferase family 2 protein [Ignavibacteriales bacterium]|nr:glycosyltransferase family 2 protein [Ignavibacteriales bacterium]